MATSAIGQVDFPAFELVLDHLHLILMREVVRAPENWPVEPLSWWVDRFVLVRSVSVSQGVFYEVLREWRFAGKDRGSGLASA